MAAVSIVSNTNDKFENIQAYCSLKKEFVLHHMTSRTIRDSPMRTVQYKVFVSSMYCTLIRVAVLFTYRIDSHQSRHDGQGQVYRH